MPVTGGGRILGLDYGTRRVGVAVSDALGLTAGPLEVIDRGEAIARISQLVLDLDVVRIVIGLPTTLKGTEGAAAAAVREFAAAVGAATGVPVTLVDERFSSVSAERTMLAGRVRRRDRRQSLDKVAAAIILQGFLDHPS